MKLCANSTNCAGTSFCLHFKKICTLFSRAFEDEKQAKLGVVECVKHGLLEPYNVLWEKEGRNGQ